MSDQSADQTPDSPPVRKRARPKCALCGKDARDAMRFEAVRPEIANLMAADHPELKPADHICGRHIDDYRTRYVADLLERERGELGDLERQVVESMAREETVSRDVEAAWEGHRTPGERVADAVADFGGSWTFISIFFAVLAVWMGFNVWASTREVFDPYPFILLNLVLSCLAAIQAPIIMMSQNRQEAKDRLRAQHDYRINLKAELEIRQLHEKVDHLLSHQWDRLVQIQELQLELLSDLGAKK